MNGNKAKRILLIAVIGIVLIAVIIWLLFHVFYIFDPGIDRYDTPALIGAPQVACVRIYSDQSKYDIDDVIELQANTGFFRNSIDAENANHIDLTARESDIFEIVFVGEDGNEFNIMEGRYPNPDSFEVWFRHDLKEFPVPASDLTFPNSIAKHLFPSTMSYNFKIQLQVKADAEYECTERLHFYFFSEGTPDTWDYASGESRGYLYVYKQGDRVYLSDKSVEDAMARAKYVP